MTPAQEHELATLYGYGATPDLPTSIVMLALALIIIGGCATVGYMLGR